MATNAEGKEVDDDDEIITEETLRRDKYEKGDVDPSKEEDENADDDGSDDDGSDEDAGEDDGKADDEDQDDDSDKDPNGDLDDDDSDTFIKEFDNIKGDNLPDYARNLEVAYRNSTKEALRLKGELDAALAKGTSSDDDDKSDKGGDKGGDKTAPTTMSDLYVKQKMDEEIVAAYTDFTKDYNQVDDPSEYKKFESTVGELSQTILNREKRIASPRELYSKAAVILGWTPIEKKPTKSEKVGIALKKKAGSSIKGGGTPKKGAGKSKVTAAMIELNRKFYPGKSDSDIREELEPYVQS